MIKCEKDDDVSIYTPEYIMYIEAYFETYDMSIFKKNKIFP